jgi:hypothetical protein
MQAVCTFNFSENSFAVDAEDEGIMLLQNIAVKTSYVTLTNVCLY